MEIYISINGVLRNFVQKFEYHYNDYFLNSDIDDSQDDIFEYKINYPIENDNILNSFTFQSREEYENFTFIEFPLEIFGHASPSYPNVIIDLNKLIYTYSGDTFTVVGLNELGKAKSSSLSFLAKNRFLGNNIKFIKSANINEEWKKCDIWITDDLEIINKCPKNKKVIKFNTDYNKHFNSDIEINNLTKFDELCLISLEKPTTSISMKSLGDAVLNIYRKILMQIKTLQQKTKTGKQY